jgi:hypothetical protein
MAYQLSHWSMQARRLASSDSRFVQYLRGFSRLWAVSSTASDVARKGHLWTASDTKTGRRPGRSWSHRRDSLEVVA